MVEEHVLTSSEARAWPMALPRAVLVCAAALSLVLVLISIMAGPDDSSVNPSAATDVDGESIVGYLVLGVALVIPAIAALTPGVTFTLLALFAVLDLGTDATLPACSMTALVIALAAGAANGVFTVRRRALVTAWTATGPTRTLDPGELDRRAPRRWRHGWVWTAAVCAATFVVATAVLVHDVAAVTAFRDRARTGEGTVRSVDDDELSMVVDIDGRRYSVPINAETPAVAHVLTMRYDPAGTRAEWTADPFDPWMPLLPMGAALSLGTAAAVVERRRRRRRRQWAEQGTGTIVALATWDGAGLSLCAADAEHATLGTWSGRFASSDEEAQDGEEALVDTDLLVGELTDEEILTMARIAATAPAGHPYDEQTSAWRREPVHVAIAPTEDLVYVRSLGGGEWWVASRRRVRPGGAAGPHLSAGPSAGSPAMVDGPVDGPADELMDERADDPGDQPSQWPADHSARPAQDHRQHSLRRSVFGFARATGRWAPWLLPAALAWFVAFANDVGVPWWRLLTAIVGAAAWAQTWSAAACPRLTCTAHWLIVRGAVMNTFVPWADVASIAHDEHAVLVRVRQHADEVDDDDEGAVVVPGGADHPPVLASCLDPALAASRLRDAAARATPNLVRAAPLRPAIPTAVAITTALAGLLALVVR